MAIERNTPLIAVVEDEPDLYDSLLAMIGVWGYESIGFVTGEEALAQIPHLLPDLVLVDIRLPGEIDGLEILEHLRNTPITATIPIMMMTAFHDDGIVAKTLALGADDFFFKPLPPFGELKARLDIRMLSGKLKTNPLSLNTKKETVFISYSRHDWDTLVSRLVLRLRSEGIDVWVDRELIEGSDDWLDEINKALKSASRFIVCVSQNSLASRDVKMEYRYAFNNNRRLYPLILESCELPAELQTIQHYSYEQLDDLVKTLKR